MTGQARYDQVADWYEREFVGSEQHEANRRDILRLLYNGPGQLIDAGCGGGANAVTYREAGWDVVGVDVSAEQLRVARERGVEVVHTNASALPFADSSFDAAAATWLYTDVNDFGAVVREIARVLRPYEYLVHPGVHPSEFVALRCRR